MIVNRSRGQAYWFHWITQEWVDDRAGQLFCDTHDCPCITYENDCGNWYCDYGDPSNCPMHDVQVYYDSLMELDLQIRRIMGDRVAACSPMTFSIGE